MRFDIKYKVILIIGVFALGVGSGYFTKPTKVETKIVEVVKKETINEETKNKVVYKERIVYKDGTVKEIERHEDSSSSKNRSLSESSKSLEKVVKNDIGLNLSLLAIVPSSSVQSKPEFALHVSKRVISNVSVGAFASTDKKIGVSIGVSF